MTAVLITSCSNRKTVPAKERLQASDLPCGTLIEVGRTWREWLKNHHKWLPATELYNGRGSLEAKLASDAVNASHWFVSAGLGLISANECVPSYDLTVSGTGPNQIRRKVLDSDFTTQAWWCELAKRRRPYRTLARLIEESSPNNIVLALPTNYLRMVLGDLCNTNPKDLKRVRLIGPPKSDVPVNLQPIWMPYDSRLDTKKSPLPGTRSDFPQRAARHFLEHVWPYSTNDSALKHARVVEEFISSLPYPSVPKRKQLDDIAIQKIIERRWLKAEGRSSRMLRILRDDEKIACEQSRFRNLFNEVKQKKVSQSEI